METNTGLGRPVPTVCRLLCSNVQSLAGNLSDLTVASSRYDLYCCALRHWSQICVTCRSCWFPDLSALSCCAEAGCLGPEGWLRTYEMDMDNFVSTSMSVVVVKWSFLGFVVRDKTYVISLYRNPELDDRILDCLLTSMTAVQAEDDRASFLSCMI